MKQPLLLAALLLVAVAHAEAPERPDILLFSIDTLRADHVGCYGYERDTTPAIDRLAAEGVRFEDARSAYSHTLPTVLGIYTGANLTRRGITLINWQQLGGFEFEDYPSLPGLLKEHGYTTCLITNHWGFIDIEAQPVWDRKGLSPGGNTVRDVVDDAIEWFEKTAKETPDQPRFAWVHVLDPHSPYSPPEPYASAFPPAEQPEPGFPGWYQAVEWRKVGRGGLAEVEARVMPDHDGNMAYLMSQYDGEILFTDTEFARLREVFESTSQRPQVIALTADHGEAFGEHQLMHHGHEVNFHQIDVPLILHAPTLLQPAVVGDQVVASNLDLFPTLLEFAGIAVPEDIDARSLLAQMKEGSGDRVLVSTQAGIREDFLGIGVHTRTEKLLFDWQPPGDRRYRYYRLDEDPKEEHDRFEPGSDDHAPLLKIAEALLEQARAHNAARQSAEEEALDEQTIDELKALGYLD